MKVTTGFEVRGTDLYIGGSGSLLGPAGVIPTGVQQRGGGRPRSGTYPGPDAKQAAADARQAADDARRALSQYHSDANAMKTALPPKPLPMSPAHRSHCYASLSERLQMERGLPVQAETHATTHAASLDTTPRPRAATHETAIRPEPRETSGGGNSQRELREYRREMAAQREFGGSHRDLVAREAPREREAAELAPRTPERAPARCQDERQGYSVEHRAERRGTERSAAEMRAASGNNRLQSLDRSVRSLSQRVPSGGSSASERLQLQRRGSAPAQRDTGPDDDCAEYSDRFLAGYERGRLLGRGACAVVWLANPAGQKDCLVAVKQVAKGNTGKKRSDCEAAKKEIFFGSYFFHPGGEPKISAARFPGIQYIAKLLDFSETKRDVWMVMEYGGTCLTKMAYEIKGEFLRGERLYRVVHLPMLQAMKRNPEVFKGMLRQLLSALVLFSEHHIVHSDIKPDNILIEEDDRHQLRCRFIDLGSAFTFDSPENLALATPEYMPPEALETCVARQGGGQRMSMSSRPVSSAVGSRKSADPVAKLQRNSQPWSFDMWSLGSIFLELCLGTPLWLSYKCRVADDQRANSAAVGLFAVPGRDPEKIITKQTDALRQRGLPNVLRNAQGVPIDASGLELLSLMLSWDPLDRISPSEALEHPWLQESEH